MENRDTASSARTLIFVNVITLAVAVIFGLSLSSLLWPYVAQNLVIGYYSRKRILALENFSTEGVKINDKAVEPTPETQRGIANFLIFHYGLFQVFYIAYLFESSDSFYGFDLLILFALSLSYVWSHHASFERNIAADRQGCPNIGTLMLLPYLRVIPMHAIMMVGAHLGEGLLTLLAFGAMKTAADVGMHYVEHQVLRKGK